MPTCELCGYTTERTDNFAKHLKSSKHIKKTLGEKQPQKEALDKFAKRMSDAHTSMLAYHKEQMDYVKKKYDDIMVEEITKRDKIINALQNQIVQLYADQKRLMKKVGIEHMNHLND